MKYFTITLGVLLFIAHSVWSVAQPEIATELALRQFENPSIATDTIQRINIWPSVWVMYAVFAMFIFIKGAKR